MMPVCRYLMSGNRKLPLVRELNLIYKRIDIMSTTSSGYGFVPVKRSDGMAYAGAQDAFLITPAGVSQNIGYGSVVEISAGYVQLSLWKWRRCNY
jgi:hypothetical protein